MKTTRPGTSPSQPLRILSVSDFEDKALVRKIETKSLEPVDLALSCGDLAPEYLSFLRDRLDVPLYFVKGNHDIRYTPANPIGCRNIHAGVVKFNGLKIMGLEGSLWYNGGKNQYTDKEMKNIIRWMWFSIRRSRGIDIVITHAPPRRIHDAEDRCHMGFETYVDLIAKYRPRYFIHGHIHKDFSSDQERMTRIGQTTVINTCGHFILEVGVS